MRVRLGFVCLILLLATGAYAGDAPPVQPQTAGKTEQLAPDVSSYNMCPEDDCGGSGGGSGSVGCYDCSSDGTSATCYTDGRYWADCQGGSICWYMSGAGWFCEPYCGRRRCYNI